MKSSIILICREGKWEDVDALLRTGQMLGFKVSVREEFETREVLVRWVSSDVGSEDRLVRLPVVPEGATIPRFLVNSKGAQEGKW